MDGGQWFTLVRFQDSPQHLTGVSQARTALEALDQLHAWDGAYPADTTVVFDPQNRPLERQQLAYHASGRRPPRRPATG